MSDTTLLKDGRITVRVRSHLRALLDAEKQKVVLINDLLEKHYKQPLVAKKDKRNE
jgi:hypothetical protein